MSISSSWDLASDAELITAVRSGETAAFGVLYERHAAAARAVAHQYSNSAADADDAVSDAFHRVFSTIQGGAGPDVAFRAYLFTVVRRVAMGRVESGRRVQATDDLETFEAAFGPGEATEDPTFAGFERGVVSRAYKSLPERWQAVLWYTEVERLSPAEIAPVLGLTANGVAALAYRAREGLRQAYLQQHLASPSSEACTIVNGKLGAYVRGGLAKRETALVESHLDECGDCRALVLELGDVNHGMRAIIAPLILGSIAVAVLQGVGFGGAAGAIAAAGLGAGGAGAGASGAAGGGASVGAGGGVSVGAGGTGAGAGAGAAGAGAAGTTGAGTLAGVGAASSAGGLGAGAVAVGGAATLSAALDAQPAAASTTAGTTAAGTTGAGATGAGGAGAAGAAGAGAAGTAAASGGLAALVASVPVTAIGLAAAGVIVAGAVGVAGAMGVFSSDDGDPDVVAAEPDIDDLTPTPPVDETTPPADEPTDEPTAPSDDPTNPANVPALDDPADEPSPEPSGTPTPSSTPTTPPPTSPPPTSPPPTEPPVVPPVLVAQPPTTAPGGFVAGEPTLLQVPVQNDGGDAGQVFTQLLFPEGTDVSVVAVDPPAGGGTVVPSAASNGWSCTTDDATATCTLPALAAKGASTLYAHVTILDDAVDGVVPVKVGVRTWAGTLAGAPSPTSVTLQVSSPPTSFSVAPVAPTVLKGVNDKTETASAHLLLTNSGTHARPVVSLSGIPAGVSVVPNAGWTCVDGIGLECTGPDTPRGATTALVLTFADAMPVDTNWTGFVTADVAPGGGTQFSLTTVSAPARYEVDVAQLTSAPGSTLDTHVTVTNTGRTTGRQVQLALDLPAGLTVIGNHSWSPCATGSGDVCRTFPTLAPGAALANVHVAFEGAVGSYPVTVVVADGADVTASTSVTITVGSEPAALAVSGPAEIVLERGVPATVSATVTNGGGSTATGVVVRADLPQGVSLVAGGACVGRNGSNRLIECAVGNLAAGASTTVTFQVLTNGAGAAGDEIVLTALWDIPGSSDDAVSEPVRIPVRVIADAPVVRASLEPQTTFVQGKPRDLVATVTNSGTTTATELRATFQLPAETFWERTANGSVWACTSTGGAGATVTCTTSSLAAGASVELAGAVRANGDAQGRVITLGLTWNGGAAPTVQTVIDIGSLPECAPAWQKGTFYRIGDRVSYQSWNYTRLINFEAIYEPGRYEQYWESEGPCA